MTLKAFDKTIPMHIHAIDWALDKGYVMSVTDLCADDGEWDVKYSADRAALIEACQATDIPNVHIFEHVPTSEGWGWRRITTFSVIDEGVPAETINDYTIGEFAEEFDAWFGEICSQY
jgi:hypothetical protein